MEDFVGAKLTAGMPLLTETIIKSARTVLYTTVVNNGIHTTTYKKLSYR